MRTPEKTNDHDLHADLILAAYARSVRVQVTQGFRVGVAAQDGLAGVIEGIKEDPRADVYAAKFLFFRYVRNQPNTLFIPVEVAYRWAQTEVIGELRRHTDMDHIGNAGLPKKLFGLHVVEIEATEVEGHDMGDHIAIANLPYIAYIPPKA